MKTTGCPSLPPELWCHIASFLTPKTLQHAKSINRVLFDLAMNERYRAVRIEEASGNLGHVLEVLRNPGLARRVHSLYLDPGIEYKDPCKLQMHYRPERASTLRRIIYAIKGTGNTSSKLLEDKTGRTLRSPEKLPSAQAVAGLITTIVPLLVNLDSFELNWDLPCDTPSPYLDLLWGCHGSKLTELRLTVTRSKMDALLLALPLLLPHLRLFHINIDWYHDGNQSDLHRAMIRSLVLLATFINTLHNTLEDLAVTCRPMFEMSPFYESLGHFNNLKTINLDTSLRLSSASEHSTALSIFVQKLSSTLENLTLSTSEPISPMSSYQFSFADLILRNLRSLTMSAEIMALSWDDTLRFLTIHNTLLESLTILGPIATMEIQKLISIIGNNASAVKKFSIATYQIEPHVLNILVQGLQCLQSLEIRLQKFHCPTRRAIIPSAVFPENCPPEDYTQPLTEMLLSIESLSTWQLQDLTLKRRLSCGCCDIVLWGLLRLFASCIPSITSFAGNGGMEESEPVNQSSVHGGRNCLKLKSGGHRTYCQNEDV